MSDPKVSILMCVFNSSDFLCSAIESVLQQPYQNIELIIIDDYSIDDSWQIACDYAAQDPRIMTIRCPENQGASAALNKGLLSASGDYITRQDSDDILAPERLVEQVSYLQSFPKVGTVGTNVIYIDPNGDEIGVSSFPLTNKEIQERLPDMMCFCGPTIMARRETFNKAGYYFVDEYSTAEDYDLCLRLSEMAEMGNLETPLYWYRQHPGSVSVAKRHHQLYYKVRALEQAAFRRYGQKPPQIFIDYIARDYLRAAILGCFSDDFARSKKCLEIALRYRPNLLYSGSLQPPLGEIILRYLPRPSLAVSLAHVELLFQDLFPNKHFLAQLKARLIGRLYVEEAFARAQNSPTHSFETHLIWKGISHDPGWLTNRGIVSILVKQTSLYRKLRT